MFSQSKIEQLNYSYIEFTYPILFVTVLITAAFSVVVAYAIAKWIGPRSHNPTKGESYECGIPTYGASWSPVYIGYYFFAIPFLMFSVGTVFLYPWVVAVRTFGPPALATIGFFTLVLVFGLAYAWRKGAPEWK